LLKLSSIVNKCKPLPVALVVATAAAAAAAASELPRLEPATAAAAAAAGHGDACGLKNVFQAAGAYTRSHESST
jgi:hypothetical protein